MQKRILFGLIIIIFLGVAFFYVKAPLREKTFSLFMRQGDYYFNGGAYDVTKAKRFYQWALKLDPEAMFVHHRLADIYFIQAEFDKALEEINKEIARNPAFAQAHYIRGTTNGMAGNLDEAEEDFKKALLLSGVLQSAGDETAWGIYNDLAWIQFQKGNYQEVEKTARAGLEKYPENPWILNALGLALLNLDRKAEGKEVFEQALAKAEKLSIEEVNRAYPTSNPSAGDARRQMILNRIRYNLTLVVDN